MAKNRKKPKKQKKNKKSNKLDFLIKFIAIIFLIIVVFWISRFTKTMDTKTTENEDFFQFIGERVIEYSGELTLSRKEGITELNVQDIELELNSSPIYYAKEPKLLLPEDMAIISPYDNGKMQKVKHFSNIKDEEYAVFLNIYNENKEKVIDITNSFLYDGDNIYIFPNGATIMCGTDTYVITPLSYVNAIYKDYIEIFDYQTQQYNIIQTQDTEVFAIIDEYKINLNTDVLYRPDQEQLLIKNINYLEDIK